MALLHTTEEFLRAIIEHAGKNTERGLLHKMVDALPPVDTNVPVATDAEPTNQEEDHGQSSI